MSGNTDIADNEINFPTNSTAFRDQPLFDYIAAQVANTVNIYYTPLLICLGTIGNLVSVFVFYTSKLRLQSTSQYLSALALSDTVFLFQLLLPWLNDVQVTDIFHHPGFCQVFVYLTYVTSCLSAWLVVAFTVERFVAVLYPLQRNAICTVKRARHIIGCISLSALLLNTPVLVLAISTKDNCNIDNKYIVHAKSFNVIDTIVSFTMPLLVIIVLNAWIMTGVYRLERARKQLLKAEGTRVHASRALACPPRSQQRVTRMLLIVSSVFVVLNLPAYTMRMVSYAYDMNTTEDNHGWAALQKLALTFFDTNFGINFILYCLSGQNFRRALRQAVPWLRRRAQRGVAVRRPVSFTRPARASSISTSGVSTCTEATTNVALNASQRRRRREPFILLWSFDNTRNRRSTPATIEHFEMSAYENNSDM